jgi:hypothetical protein
MKHMRTIALTVIFFTLLCKSVQSQNYVTLYEDCNYNGKSYFVAAGNYRSYQMRVSNDRLSAMRIPYGFKVTIYENDGFTGRSNTFTSDEVCLATEWNEMASSIVVENIYQNGQPVSANDFVTFYTDSYYRGSSKSLRPGSYTGAQLDNLKYSISSFAISGNLRVKLYPNNETLSGYAETFEQSQSSLQSSLNDKVGSLIIEYKTPNAPIYNNNNPLQGKYVTFYSECNYGGNAIRLLPGYYAGEKLGMFKNATSAVEIPNGFEVKVFFNDNLYGQSYTLFASNDCFDYQLKNRIASVVIEEKNMGYGGNTNNPSTNNNSQVIIYTDGNYQGQSAMLLPGTYATMNSAGGFPSKALSSLQVPAGYTVVLYEEENFMGKSYTVTASKSGFSFSNWNDRTASIKVFRN